MEESLFVASQQRHAALGQVWLGLNLESSYYARWGSARTSSSISSWRGWHATSAGFQVFLGSPARCCPLHQIARVDMLCRPDAVDFGDAGASGMLGCTAGLMDGQ